MTTPPKRPRLLLLVIGYVDESALSRALERLPARLFAVCDTEILIVVDATEQRIGEIGGEFRRRHREARMTVLRNEFDPGHGGDQKVGYTHAIRQNFDLVALVHGDGRYAPEEIPRLLEPLIDGTADVVFGGRLARRAVSGSGGMPIGWRLRNRFVALCQNALLGTRLSDPHCGYRLFSVRALERIPFVLGSSGSHFDHQVVLQLANAGMRIVELPVPAYRDHAKGGPGYSLKVLLWTLRNVAHRSGILYQRALDTEGGENTHYGLKLGYPSSHTYAIAAVAPGASVLDLGSGPGTLARELEAKGCRVTVVDRQPPPSSGEDREFLVQDLDEPLEFRVDDYEYILLLDILEHLQSPERFLERLRELFDHQPRRVILTTPNIAFFIQRGMLLLGQFNYGKKGVLDLTHSRLFTFRSLRRLLRECGFRIRRVRGVPAPFPLVFGDGRLGRSAVALNRFLIAVSKSLFSYQIYVEMTTTPGVDYILERSRLDASDRGEA